MHYQLLSLAVVLAASSLAIADEATDKEIKSLEGEWTWVEHEVGGTQMFPDANDRPQIKIEKDKWFFKNKAMPEFKEAGTFKLDVTTTPRCVDLVSTAKESAGQKNECIYKLEEDKLTIVVNLNADDKSRPMAFETKDKPGMIKVVLERKK
jgi:uncharacterized protein (TIGR03067 family)